MFKIKSLILLFLSFFLLQCSAQIKSSKYTYSVSYIGGGESGLQLTNFLTSYLKSIKAYDKNSNLKINSSITHRNELYITRVDNTSDRELITTELSINIQDIKKKCTILEYTDDIDQYFVISAATKFISNNKAVEEIKLSNTETLVLDFIETLNNYEPKCNEQQYTYN